MTKFLIIFFSIISLVFLKAHKLQASMFADFNFVNNDVTQGFTGWNYSPYGNNDCGIYNGSNQSNMCSDPDTNGLTRAFLNYYNGYNNDHMGWMRWGYIDSEDTLAIEGNSLKVVLTGGAYDDNGTVAYSGLEVRSKEQFDAYIANGQNPYADRTLPGDLTIYFTIEGNNNPFQELIGNDRLSVWVLPPEDSAFTFDSQKYSASYGRPENLFAWYPFVVDADGDHYYHELSNINMGGWIHLIFDAHPIHNNGGDNNPYSYYRAGGRDFPGDSVSYFNNVNRFALRGEIVRNLPSPSYIYFDKLEAYHSSQPENDETIAGIGVGYDPVNKRFDIAFGDKYRCAECSAKYQVRYSFSPITNANFDNATLAYVTNFVRGVSSNRGEIVKPSNGYNQIWAGIDLEPTDKNNLTEGTTIYFAVKDISDRSALQDRDTYDLEMVNVPGVGDVRRVDLIKTIDYTIYPVNRPLEITTDELSDAHINSYYEVALEGKGGIQPYTWTVDGLPDGLSLSSDGVISGTPTEIGSFNPTFTITDSHSPTQSTNKQISINIYNQENCTDGIDNDNDSLIDCQDVDCESETTCSDVLVDFGGVEANNIFGTSWNNVFMDTYTDYTNIGPGGTISTAGNNGSYNYQGVGGNSFNFQSGDKVKVYWYNNAGGTINFTPRISFDDNNRESSPPDGEWKYMTYTEIPAGSSGASEYVFDDNSAGAYSLVNVSSQSNNTDKLVCDKIVWIHSGENISDNTRADVDNNSQINTTDAMLTLRNSLGLDMSGTNWQSSSTTGDVNCDGNSNSTDAMLIIKYSLGLSMEGTGWCL